MHSVQKKETDSQTKRLSHFAGSPRWAGVETGAEEHLGPGDSISQQGVAKEATAWHEGSSDDGDADVEKGSRGQRL